MFRKLNALAGAVQTLGGAVSSGRARGLRDRALLDLAELEEQQRILDDHMKPRYSPEQYRTSLERIEADRRRLTARIDRYQAQLEEITATAQLRAAEAESDSLPR
jgi:DNA repair ATPase RecN